MPAPTPRTIARHLSRADPVLARIIGDSGVQALPKIAGGFPSVATAIVNQQISGQAASAILRRLRRAYGARGFPSPEWFARTDAAALRRAGLSRQKSRYLKDLARHVLHGKLNFRRLPRVTDDEVVGALTAVQGIGPWTAQMYLIFALNRPDVLPTGDLGIRKAVARGWDFRSLPAESTIRRLARPWAPYRSHASYYLWSSLRTPLGVVEDAPGPG